MDRGSQRIKVKVGTTCEAAQGALFISVPSVRITEYGAPETRVDVIVGAVGGVNEETTLRVGQRLEYDAGAEGIFEIRLLTSENPIEFLVTGLESKPVPNPEEPSQ